MGIGENIKKLRNKKGLTQKELAEIMGVTSITIQNYESNRREPKVEMLKRIADVLDASIFDFLEEDHTWKKDEIELLPDVNSDAGKARALFNKLTHEENTIAELLKLIGFQIESIQVSPDMYNVSFKGISRTLGPAEFNDLLEDILQQVKGAALSHII